MRGASGAVLAGNSTVIYGRGATTWSYTSRHATTVDPSLLVIVPVTLEIVS